MSLVFFKAVAEFCYRYHYVWGKFFKEVSLSPSIWSRWLRHKNNSMVLLWFI